MVVSFFVCMSKHFAKRFINISKPTDSAELAPHPSFYTGTCQVTLGGGGYDGGKEAWLLSRVLAVPTRGSFQARVNRLRRRGHVGFTEDGDLYVADSVGRMVWSLAEEGEREVERQKRGGVEEKTIYSTFSTFHKTTPFIDSVATALYPAGEASLSKLQLQYRTKCCSYITWHYSIAVIQSILFKGMAVRQPANR